MVIKMKNKISIGSWITLGHFSIAEIDNHPNLQVETGNIGRYRFTHKYIIVNINK